MTRCAATGSRQPRSSSGSSGSSSTRPRSRRAAAGPTRISFGSALLLEARGEVDGLAGRERRVAVVGDDLAGLDADPRLEAELLDALERRDRRADGALGVVLVRERHAEGGHDGVAGELLDRAAVRDDAVRDLVEEAADAPADDLGIGVGDELRRGDEVDEEHGCELALHASMVVARGGATSGGGSIASSVLDPKVFKAYDVRGIYPDELDEDGAYAIGRAYVQQFEPRRIAVGRDMRLSSPQMAAAVMRGAADGGRGGARPRARRDGDGLFRGRRARARRRDRWSPPRTTRRSTRA